MKTFHLFVFLVVLWLGPVAFSNQRPNIVVLLADDLGWGDVGWHGSEIPTPELDRLAGSGAQLDAFYVQPVCTPTRAALMTGRYPMRYGLQVGVVRPWAQFGLSLPEQTLAAGLQSAGYATAIVGKWHLGHFEKEYLPTRRGFGHQYGHYNGAVDYFMHTRDGGFDWHRADRRCNDQGYSTHLLADEAVRFVEEHAGKQPFFLYLPFNAVHAPYQVPERYLEQFPHLQGNRRIYAGMLSAMDEAIGKVIAAIDRTNQRNNTFILFSSDNGGPLPGKITSNGHLRSGKGSVYEGGVRVAACASWPTKISAGTIVNQPLHIVDLYPTLLNLVGAQVQQQLAVDGIDAWQAIAEDKPLPQRDILINATPTWGALRSGVWKLVVNGDKAGKDLDGGGPQSPVAISSEQVELFNLEEDPSEANDLAASHPEQLQKLLDRWKVYQHQAIPPLVKLKPEGFQVPAVWGEPDGPASKLSFLRFMPKFEAIDDQGNQRTSTDIFGRKTVVLYFYPADFTGGCTKQACAYRDRQAELERLGVEVIGISGDSVDNHRQFKAAHRLNFSLLADPDGKIAEAFGVPVTREAKHVTVDIDNQTLTLKREVTSKRWTFIVDSTGGIIYQNSTVAAADDADQVIQALKELQQGG